MNDQEQRVMAEAEEKVRRLYADGASDSLISDYEAIVNGTTGLTAAELYWKEKQDLVDNHRRRRPRIPIEVLTTPDGGVFVQGVNGPNRQEAVLLRDDLHRAGAHCDFYEGGDCDQYEILTYSGHPKAEWPELLHQALLDVGYIDVRRFAVVWPDEPVKARAVAVSLVSDDFS